MLAVAAQVGYYSGLHTTGGYAMSRDEPENEHERLLYSFPSAYRMSKDTGIPLSTCKLWRKKGKIADPGAWRTICECASFYGYGLEYRYCAYLLAEQYHT